jgi:hypothetical protein
VRLTTNKSISRLVGIWTFLLLLIFKGVFPKPAFAFLSSLDACAANPQCADVIGLELSPTIAAPTADAAGTTAISTTTATGATTSSVEAVAGTTVVGDMRLPGVAVFYIWNQAQNEQAQNKAKEKYCAANPSVDVCNTSAKIVTNNPTTFQGDCFIDIYYQGRLIDTKGVYLNGVSNVSWESGLNEYGHSSYELIVYTANGTKIRTDWFAWNQSYTWSLRSVQTIPTPWKDWPQQKRNAAVQLLNNSDWQGLISSMPAGGILNPGDKIHAPTIVIPGQETDDLNTPADERLLRKESGFFTFPGIPDFDKDGIPDSIDLDNDNDGIVNTNDPEPYNPNLPFASSLPDESAKVTPEVLQYIRDIVSKHENFKCIECASEIEAYLREQGIHGRRIKLDTPRQTRYDGNIYDDSLPQGSDVIADNGYHEGIAIKINGEEKVFDNHHPNGVATEQWKGNLLFDSKIRFGANFIETGYSF